MKHITIRINKLPLELEEKRTIETSQLSPTATIEKFNIYIIPHLAINSIPHLSSACTCTRKIRRKGEGDPITVLLSLYAQFHRKTYFKCFLLLLILE